MRRRHLLFAAALGFVASGIACVDLFHSTDFETLCTRSPNDPKCASDAAAVADVVTEPAIDARRPHPDFCAWTPAEARKEALRACAWLGACEGPLGESRFGQCAVRAQLAYDCNVVGGANKTLRPAGETDELWSCLATATSCAQVDQCVFPKGVDTCRPVDTTYFIGCGVSNPRAAVKCALPAGGRAVGVEPCALLGQTCAKDKEPTAPGSCSGTKAFGCSTSTCAGTSAVACEGNHDVGLDCAASGSTCVVDDAGAGPICVPKDAPACNVDAPPACDGTTVTQCVGGKLIRINCGALGLECDATAAKLYDPATACTL
ncbi:MAG TPA: hypothetical protein VLT33_50585, partial [Labilithrix sp.]|nr:hypothetical protein [Labilithrix sp.]